MSWPATRRASAEVLERLTSAPFVLDKAHRQHLRVVGLELLVGWLADQSGPTWQDRWLSSGADTAGAAWRQVPTAWLHDHGRHSKWAQDVLAGALVVAISADIVRPSLRWLLAGPGANSHLVTNLAASRDPEGFARLRDHCDASTGVSVAARSRTLSRSALIMAANGGRLADITVGDVVELLEAEAKARMVAPGGAALFYRVLHEMGIFVAQAPTTLRALRTRGQRSPEELIDRYRLACAPVRDLLVDYMRERQPALDYTSLESLAHFLGKRFWADIEAHHPGIDSLRLPVEVANGWKRRLATKSKTTRIPTGEKTEVRVARVNYRECLTPVRAFYLDLAQWAVEDPGRWAQWVAPCPIGAEEINRKKAMRHLKSRMDARTRERLPVLPVVVRSVEREQKAAEALLDAARRVEPGETFGAAGSTFVRSAVARPGSTIWMDDPATAKRRNLSIEEDHAFWAWAIVEVLRATGIRIEELQELSHHSLVQYRLPTTGELVPLLQIVPSKTDAERLLVVSPELADVLAAIIQRIRCRSGAVPLVAAYDRHERAWSPPAPLLFQRRVGTENQAIAAGSVRQLLAGALVRTGLVDPVDGQSLRYTPHDFRRMFITDAILNGLPPHIAQVIAGHRDINVTLGYEAVYPDEAIQAHLGFLARRRSLRPSEEYRVPTDDEWQEFLGHFERRKVSAGTCARAFGTPCIHEHACVRCPMLWPDPDQRARMVEIRDNLTARIAEAEREGWLGEVEGLQVSLAGAENKLAQIDSRSHRHATVHLDAPTLNRPSDDDHTAPTPLENDRAGT